MSGIEFNHSKKRFRFTFFMKFIPKFFLQQINEVVKESSN